MAVTSWITMARITLSLYILRYIDCMPRSTRGLWPYASMRSFLQWSAKSLKPRTQNVELLKQGGRGLPVRDILRIVGPKPIEVGLEETPLCSKGSKYTVHKLDSSGDPDTACQKWIDVLIVINRAAENNGQDAIRSV